MPELPDIALYCEALETRILHRPMAGARILNPFFLRTVEPPLASVVGGTVTGVQRIGKRIAIGFDGHQWIVIHLMIAGRLQWQTTPPKPARRHLAQFAFEGAGYLTVTEAGTKRRAWLKVLADDDALATEDPGGLEPIEASFEAFAAQLRDQPHTLKRALCHPKLFSGIGNAYSDEILHRAKLSPFARCSSLTTAQLRALHAATVTTLSAWLQRLREERHGEFPGKVTAFHERMAVHGKYGQPCRVCEAPIQRIRYAQRETNYCARCQTQGQVLKDRRLSRLLKQDWPSRIEQWE